MKRGRVDSRRPMASLTSIGRFGLSDAAEGRRIPFFLLERADWRAVVYGCKRVTALSNQKLSGNLCNPRREITINGQ